MRSRRRPSSSTDRRVDARARRGLEALGAFVLLDEAPVPGEALALGGTAELIVRVPPGRFAALNRWARREPVPVLDLRNPDRPFLIAGRIPGVVAVAETAGGSGVRLALFDDLDAGSSVAALIADLGLDAIRIGGARMVPGAPGWAEVASPGTASAGDFGLLADYVAERVKRATGVALVRGFRTHAT